MAGQGPHARVLSGSANKETRGKAEFIPTESSCIGRTDSGTMKGLWDLTQCGW